MFIGYNTKKPFSKFEGKTKENGVDCKQPKSGNSWVHNLKTEV